jgi:hypothetical protein
LAGLAGCIAESFTTVIGNTTGAPAPSTNPTSCLGYSSCINGCPSVWHRVIGTGGRMSASTCSAPVGSQLLDSVLYLWTGRCDSLTCLSADDDGCKTGDSLSWQSTLGAIYHIQVTGYYSILYGPFLLRVDGTKTVVQSQSTSGSISLNLSFRVSRRVCPALMH